MNTKQIGEILEDLVVAYFQEIDPKCRKTKASGAKSEKSDIKIKGFKIECKKRNEENCIINRKVWLKLNKELNIYKFDIPILILQNKFKEIFAVLDIKDLIKILKGGI